MNLESLATLAAASGAEELQRALEALCLPYGGVQNLRLIQDKNDKSYYCFIDSASREGNAALMREFGGTHFGNGIVFRIPPG